MNFKKSVKIALAQHERNQTWLAERLGVSRQNLSARINHNSPRSDLIVQIASALDMSVSELIALGE